MRRIILLVGVALILVAAVALVGCQAVAQKAAESAIKQSTGVDIQKNGNGASIQTSQGAASIGEGAKIPADFPSDVPVYQPSTVKAAVTDNSTGKTGFVVNLESPDAKTTVFDWYKTQIPGKGWKVMNTVEAGGGAGGITAENATSTLVVAVADGSKGGTNITLTVAPKK